MAARLREAPGLALAGLLALAAACATPPENPELIAADAATSARVRASLLADPLVGGSAIGVEVHRGVLTLTGNVPGESAAARAVAIARSTPGVREVVDRLAWPGRPVGLVP